MEYEIKPQEKFSLGLRELWQHRELFYFFTWRDIKVKYKQTVLGFAWAVLQPLLMTLIFSLLFGKALNVPSQNLPYPVFVLSGLLLWNVFSSGITSAGNSMVSNAGIIKKIYFPRLIIPVSSVLVALFDFLMALLVFIAVLVYYHTEIYFGKLFLFLPISIVITSFSALGAGAFLSALNVKYRDFRYIIPFLVQALLFVTPVIYPVSIFHSVWIKYVLAMNPMYSAITLFRCGFSNFPLETNLLAISLSSAVLIFLAGIIYFRKAENYFADLA